MSLCVDTARLPTQGSSLSNPNVSTVKFAGACRDVGWQGLFRCVHSWTNILNYEHGNMNEITQIAWFLSTQVKLTHHLITVTKLENLAFEICQLYAINGPPWRFFSFPCSGSYFCLHISFVHECTSSKVNSIESLEIIVRLFIFGFLNLFVENPLHCSCILNEKWGA